MPEIKYYLRNYVPYSSITEAKGQSSPQYSFYLQHDSPWASECREEVRDVSDYNRIVHISSKYVAADIATIISLVKTYYLT